MLYKIIIVLLLLIVQNTAGNTQPAKNLVKNATAVIKKDTIKPIKDYKPEILTSGFIDVINSGQLNASARFVRLYIGEPGKIAIPISIYSGISSNNLQNSNNTNTSLINKNNDQLYNNFINPLSGIANISIDGINILNKKNNGITKAGLTYQFGEKILTGYKSGLITNPQTGKPINFFNSFATLGIYFQTGAWERTNAKNLGLFWTSIRFISCYTSNKQLQEILPNIKTNGIYTGYCIAWGIEINNLLNLKILYYKYLKEPEINYSLPIYQFSFNYSVK